MNTNGEQASSRQQNNVQFRYFMIVPKKISYNVSAWSQIYKKYANSTTSSINPVLRMCAISEVDTLLVDVVMNALLPLCKKRRLVF